MWYENGKRRQCQSATEEGLAARIEKVTVRLTADAPGMECPGADLIAYYLSPGRHPAGRPWSRKHADTQRRLCARYLAPVIAGLACEDIKTGHMQAAVNAAPTAKEGARVRRCISALVGAGITGGYLANPRLKEVHWQAGNRSAPEPEPSIAGESVLFVDPSEIPAPVDVAKLGQALAVLGGLYELMACFAAYTGLRWGELAALTIGQVDQAARVVTVDRKVIEIGGQLYLEAPKGRKQRRTIYPRHTPEGYPLADMVTARVEQARAGQDAGPTPWAWCSPPREASTGAPLTSPAVSWPPPTGRAVDAEPLIEGGPIDISLDSIPDKELSGREVPVLTIVDWAWKPSSPPPVARCCWWTADAAV
jgi:hypothetical protein